MIEILFGESEAAAMKAAKSKIVIGHRDNGPVSVIGKTGREQDFCGKEVRWIPGTSKEVICLGLMLDIGDIKEAADSDYRKRLILSLLSQNQWESDRETEAELEKAATFYGKELRRLREYMEAGESIRIWYSDAPYSRCGLCFVCHFLKGFDNPVSVVKLPEYMVKERCITIHHNWGNIPAEEFANFLRYEKVLTETERRWLEALWLELTEENTPLRAVINGELIIAEEDFYDFLIWRHLTDQPVKEARLIGDILGHHPLSVGDWWYASRIEHFIREGRIQVAEDSEKKYARIIRRPPSC